MTTQSSKVLPPSPWHPLARSLATGLITKVFTDATPTPTGLMYGAISGVVSTFIPRDSKTAGIGQNLLNTAIPWGVSAAIMNGTFKVLNKPIFRMNPATAFGIASGTELFLYGTRDTVRVL